MKQISEERAKILIQLYKEHCSMIKVSKLTNTPRSTVWRVLRACGILKQKKRLNTIDDFWNNIDKNGDNGCWVWKGRIARRGYGEISIGGINQSTHRLSYILANGSIPDGMQICHKCDNPPCCNPDHLFAGTISDNKIDCILKGRHPRVKLKPSDVLKIRLLRSTGLSFGKIALQFNISKSTAMQAAKGKNWSYIK